MQRVTEQPTDPDSTVTTAWISAVRPSTPSEIHQRPHALRAAFHHGVYLVSRLMRMRAQRMPQPGHHPRSGMLMHVRVLVVMGALAARPRITAGGIQSGSYLQDGSKTPLQHLHHSALAAPATESPPTGY